MQKTSKLARDGAVWGLIMVAPTIIGLLVLNIWPFIQAIYMSFSKSLPFGMFEFEGIDNYVEMFQNVEFWKATWNTILFCILTVPVGIFLALLVAVLLNTKIRGRTTFRAIFFLPMVVAPAAVAMVWKWIFNSQYGIINSVLGTNMDGSWTAKDATTVELTFDGSSAEATLEGEELVMQQDGDVMRFKRGEIPPAASEVQRDENQAAEPEA